MSKDLNQCNFIGNLGQDPEIREMASGKVIANFSIASGDDYKNKESGEKVERTNWIRCVAFEPISRIVNEYVKKGDKIFVSGKQVTRKWQDSEGKDRYTTEIVANEMQMLSRSTGVVGDSAGEAKQPSIDFDEDTPF